MAHTIDKSRLFFYLRLAFGISLLIILVRIVDFRHLILTLLSVKPHLMAMGLLTMMLNFLLKTYKWASILWIQKPHIPLIPLLRFNFISVFLGNFLPTSMSPDIVRIYYISKHIADPRGAISSIVVDRIIGSFSIAIVTILGFLALQQINLFPIRSLVSYGIFAFLLLSVATPLALQNSAFLAGTVKLLDRCTGRKLSKKVQEMHEHLLLYQHQRAAMAKALCISFLNLFMAVLEFYIIAKGFSTEIALSYFFLFIPLAIFLTMLPISLGGIGVLEAAMVFFFSKVGMPAEICLSIALVHRALQIVSTLPGGAIYLLEGFSTKKLSREEMVL
jgi:hypothetical protein